MLLLTENKTFAGLNAAQLISAGRSSCTGFVPGGRKRKATSQLTVYYIMLTAKQNILKHLSCYHVYVKIFLVITTLPKVVLTWARFTQLKSLKALIPSPALAK